MKFYPIHDRIIVRLTLSGFAIFFFKCDHYYTQLRKCQSVINLRRPEFSLSLLSLTTSIKDTSNITLNRNQSFEYTIIVGVGLDFIVQRKKNNSAKFIKPEMINTNQNWNFACGLVDKDDTIKYCFKFHCRIVRDLKHNKNRQFMIETRVHTANRLEPVRP